MRLVKLRMTPREFRQLPRHPAYKYEYIDGRAWLTPRPRTYHAVLELRPPEASDDGVNMRPIADADWTDLVRLFSFAFHNQPPFLGLSDRKRRSAAREILDHARNGGDGPFVEQTSFIAEADRHAGLVGAILITLLPNADPTDWRAFSWPESPPADAIARRIGRPHLTWIFVHPWAAGQGVGTALLHAATRRLLDLGYTELASTFLLGNDSSALWHWRNGFQLVASPWSMLR
jgi:GNAT superfamily N-acetyltransferase